MARYAVKFWSEVDNEKNYPDCWVAITIPIEGLDPCPEGYTEMSDEELDAYRMAYQDEYEAWELERMLAEHKYERQQMIDEYTNNLIERGFRFPPPPDTSGLLFNMTMENQFNYKAECDMRDYLTYPHRIKGQGCNYYDFQSANHYFQFYLFGMQHIRFLLTAGWTLKNMVESCTTIDEIESIEDCRDVIDGIIYCHGVPVPELYGDIFTSSSSSSSSTNS